MDEQELEDWFSEERHNFEKEYKKELMAGVDREKTKSKYDKRYRKLIRDYQKRQERLYEREQLVKRLQRPRDRFKHSIKSTKKRFKAWRQRKKKQLQKWLFDIKFRYTVLR